MSKVLNWVENQRWLGLGSHILLALLAIDYLLQKYLAKNIVSDFLADFLAEFPVWLLTILLVIAFCVSLVPTLQKYFPTLKYKSPEPDSIRQLLFGVNSHALNLGMKLHDGTIILGELDNHHNLNRHLWTVTTALAEHVVASNEAIVRPRDIFITVYKLDAKKKALNYLHHYPPNRDAVNSKKIPLNEEKYEGYECVKCLKVNKTGSIIYDKKGYKKSTSARYTNLKHYIGFKIEKGREVVGFVNIEFHSEGAFADYEQMVLFYEQELIVFKLFYDHHYLHADMLKKLVAAHRAEEKL